MFSVTISPEGCETLCVQPSERRERRRAARSDPGRSFTDSAALARGEHLVHDAVLERLGRREDLVAVDVAVDLLDRLAGVTSHGLLEPCPHAQDLGRLDLDVGRLTVT